MEKENTVVETEAVETAPAPKQKKNLKWLWITLALVLLAGVMAWCIYSAVQEMGIEGIFRITAKNQTFSASAYSIIALIAGIFIIAALGYLLGRITIKGVSLGTAGVFLVAILFGYLFTLIPSDMPVLGAFAITDSSAYMYKLYGSTIQNIGLVLFVGSVGFIAGPKFFKNLKKNATSYVMLGAVIIFIGAALAVAFAFIPGIGAEFSIGILSGALTTTPGFSAAQEAAKASGGSVDIITLGHAIAYPFGVIGVVLFVQLMPKFLKADMNKERALLTVGAEEKIEKKKGLFNVDEFGLMPFALAIVLGLVLGAINIPLTKDGYLVNALDAQGNAITVNGSCFSLGTTGGVLIMCLIFGHFGRIGKMSLEIPEKTLKVFREVGLMLFLIGAGVSGGVSLVSEIANAGGAMIVVWGLLGGIVMTIVPMIVGYVIARYVLKLPLLFNLGSITGGMTSTPALGTLIGVSKTEDVAAAYASTYPIALVLVVLASQLIVTLI